MQVNHHGEDGFSNRRGSAARPGSQFRAMMPKTHREHELQQSKETPLPLLTVSQTMQAPTGMFNKAIITAHTSNSLIFFESLAVTEQSSTFSIQWKDLQKFNLQL